MRLLLAVAVLVAAVPPPAAAGGLVLPVRGVRSLARGGAFVAGADDADALWQNPAGLAHAAGNGTRALLFDLGLVHQPVDYTAPDGATASNQQPSQPVPSLAGSLGIGDRLVIAGGLAAPYLALHRYPADGPTRFQSVASSESAFVLVAVGIAVRVTDRVRIGAALYNQFSQLRWSVVMTGCPPMQACDPADRTFDMPVDIDQTDYLSPSGAIGVQIDAGARTTLGLAIEAPRRVSATGALAARLPTNTLFENGRITGDDVAVSFTLPPIVRAGVEARPLPALRVEAALAVELWGMHDEITIEPDGIVLEDVAGGPYPFTAMAIARDYATSFAPSLGVEYHGDRFAVAAGVAYETAAAPARHVSVLTVDAGKTLVALGGGYEEAGWQIGGALGYVHVADVAVSPDDAAVSQLAALGGAAANVPVNAGTYATSYLLAGLRFARRW